MKLVYQTIIDKNKGNCAQAAIASLLELELDEVPNFKGEGKDFWDCLFNFIKSKGYQMYGTLYNPRLQAAENYDFYKEQNKMPDDRFEELKEMEGVKGCFFATVYSPKFYDPLSISQITHAVIVDQFLNVVNPVNKEYEGMTKFPLHDLIGFNGILNVMMIEKQKRHENTKKHLGFNKRK